MHGLKISLLMGFNLIPDYIFTEFHLFYTTSQSINCLKMHFLFLFQIYFLVVNCLLIAAGVQIVYPLFTQFVDQFVDQ